MTDSDHLAATPAFARARDDADDHHAMTISEEVLHVSTEWAEAGRVRFRRRIVTETRTVQVTLRREELQIEVEDVDEKRDVLTGSRRDGLATSPPQGRKPLIIVLQEEVPDIAVRLRPYERVTVEIGLASRAGRVSAALRHEELTLDATRAPAPDAPHG